MKHSEFIFVSLFHFTVFSLFLLWLSYHTCVISKNLTLSHTINQSINKKNPKKNICQIKTATASGNPAIDRKFECIKQKKTCHSNIMRQSHLILYTIHMHEIKKHPIIFTHLSSPTLFYVRSAQCVKVPSPSLFSIEATEPDLVCCL